MRTWKLRKLSKKKKIKMKSDLPLNLRRAEQKAAEIIDSLGITSPEHIRLKDIAYDRGAVIVEGPLKGAAASLVRRGQKATIRIQKNEIHPERKRFSIAHELGHFVLKHKHDLQLVCTENDMLDWYHDSGQESEANTFAGELLLPRKLIQDRCDVREVNFRPVRNLATDFRTSLTATAIRFVRFCPEMCAFVFSKNAKIEWFYKSNDWWPFIRKGRRLDSRTVAADFFKSNKGIKIPDEPIEIDGDAWVENDRVETIVEHSIGSQKFGSVFSILWIRS